MIAPVVSARLEFVCTARGLVLWADSLATLRRACPWLSTESTWMPPGTDAAPVYAFAHPNPDYVLVSTARANVDDADFPIAGRDVPALQSPTWWRDLITERTCP